MEPLNEHQQQVNQIDQNVLRQKNVMIVLLCFCFIFCTIYLQAMCMIPGVQLCSMNGIEAPVPFQQSLIAYYFFTIMFLYLVYYALENLKQTMVVFLKWPLLLYVLGAIIMGIISIVKASGMGLTDVQEGWNKLTQWRKQSYYNSDQQQLLDENKRNLILIAIYHLIYGVALLILFALLFNYQVIMPKNWRPPFSSRPIRKNNLLYRNDELSENAIDEKQDEENVNQNEQPSSNNQQQQQDQQNKLPIDNSKIQEPHQSTVFAQKRNRFAAKKIQDSQIQQSQVAQEQASERPFQSDQNNSSNRPF